MQDKNKKQPFEKKCKKILSYDYKFKNVQMGNRIEQHLTIL